MKRYIVEEIMYRKKQYYLLREVESMNVIGLASQYLKHKINQGCSPNTVRRLAYALAHYWDFLAEKEILADQVLDMKYAEQQEFFVSYLNWLKEGRYSNGQKIPNNNTCNSYLCAVLGFYEYMTREYECPGGLKVLESRELSFNNSVGVRFGKTVYSFRGLLPKEESRVKTIEKQDIIRLLEAATNVQTRLIILLLAETGFRIGELLGVRYGEDIDYERKTISVRYREGNENGARAKNAENRRQRISDDAFDLLSFYIAENRDLLARSEYLFVVLNGDTKGKPLTANAVYSQLGILRRRTGIEVTPHMLRHYFANERRKAGMSLIEIANELGHRNVHTTERYLHITDEEMLEAEDRYFSTYGSLYDFDKLLQ